MYMMNYFDGFGMMGWNGGGTMWAGLFSGFALVMVWSFFWKGLALWHSARRAQPWWFVAMFFLNTAGILEIVYLFAVAKLKVNDLFTAKK